MTITAKYNGINFFGFHEYMECSETLTDLTLKRAIAGLKKNKDVALHFSYGTENTAFYYDSYDDFENGIVTVHHANSYYNVDAPVKMSFSKARKKMLGFIKETA